MLHHVLLEVGDLDRSASFYDTMLAPLGWRRHFDEDKTIGYGLLCVSGLGIVAVKAAYENGIRAGGTSIAEPGERRSYGSGSYSAFLKDPDGYEIEITVGSD
jgi:predicted lactoylglutathione lyase